MYSLVLMTAMTAGAPETPTFFGLFQGFCNRPVAGCNGCGGGCRGYANGCRGGCSGCTGCTGCTGCFGCSGCYGGVGGGSGMRMSAGSMAYLSGQSVFPPFVTAGASPIYIGSEGIWAGTWSYSGIAPGAPPSFIPGSVGKKNMPEPKEETSARIIVHVPANAKVFIDGQLQSGDSSERHFYTPPLPTSGSFYYDLRIETVKDGKTVVDEKKVIVQAGALVHQEFNPLGRSTSLASGNK